MRFNWLALSFLSIILFCSPAKAGKLLSWEYEAEENRLVFLTEEGVQPQAKLLANPTRLVIDLPGTILGSQTVREEYSGTIRSLRIGQFDQNTARIVIELAPGYTLDPQQVQFRGLSSTQWSVELPTPRITPLSRVSQSNNEQTINIPPVSSNPSPLSSPRSVPSASDSVSSQPSPVSNSSYVRTTRNGFFIGIDGNRSDRIEQSREDDEINFDLEGVILPQDLATQSVAVNEYGVNQIEFTQVSTSPPQARVSLKVSEDSPDWLATFSRIRGLILVPRGQVSTAIASSDRNSNEDTRNDDSNTEYSASEIRSRLNRYQNQTIIDSVELTDGDSQLLISGNRDLTAQIQPSSNGIYEIRINNALLGEPFQGPQLQANSPVSEVVVRQESSDVLILVTTRLGIRLGQMDQPETNLVALPLERGLSLTPPDSSPLLPPEQTVSIDVPRPERITTPISQDQPLPSNTFEHNKPLVVIDAGHGGQDPGTIGIGQLEEKHIVLPISLDVAEILREQGIEVKMTRDSDYFISLEGRTDLANKIQADLFVSIHANAINMSRPDINGLETYYYKSGRRLAEVIHWSILNGVNIKDRGIRRARFYVLRHSTMPAVLVEVGFVTGAEDAPRLKDPNHRRQMAEAIARGIIEYIKQNRL